MPPRQARSTVQQRDCNDDHTDPQDARIEKLERQVENLSRQIALLNSVVNSPANSDANHGFEKDSKHNPSNFNVHNYDSRINHPYYHGDKLELPEFSGSATGEDFLDWLDEVERIFELIGLRDDIKVKLVAMKLKGLASAWWKYLTSAREKKGESKINSWEEMKEKMRENFIPRQDGMFLFRRLQEIQQGDRNVEDYTEEFYYLVAKNTILSEPEEELVRRYIRGLRLELKHEIESHQRGINRSKSMTEVYKMAWIFECYQHQICITEDEYQSGGSGSNQERTSQVSATQSVAHRSDMGNFEGKVKGKGKSVSCYKCNEMDHTASECQKFRKNTAKNSKQAKDNEEMPSEEAGGDNEESNIYKPEEEIFRTKCTVNGKVCKVIISSGFCENIISQEVVDKLQLKVEKHPNPYQLAWIKDEVIMVSSKCLVSFSIGNAYHDSVWCDVAKIDVCQIILGRPWQYDRETVYSGRANTYTFLKDNKKIVLTPIREMAGWPKVSLVSFCKKKYTTSNQ